MRRELVAAGITDPRLAASYDACRRLNAAHGRTYFLATRLLPPAKRPFVHALYGFARYADDILDDRTARLTAQQRAERLDALAAEFQGCGGLGHGVLPAVRHTIERWDIPPEPFTAFLRSMRMDLTVTAYPTYADLLDYMEGSAVAIGLEMLPILQPRDVAAATPAARDLGLAFQLTNFVRDVGEDLLRGRLYLPLEDLDAHGVTREQLASGRHDRNVVRLVQFEIARIRGLYRSASRGVPLIHPDSRDAIQVALTLYAGIVDAIEQAGWRVLDRRAVVPARRRLAVAGPGYVRAVRARSTARHDARVASTRANPNPKSSTGA